jgi:hypothetical protein
MIRDIETLRKALKGSSPQFAGVILWEGASKLDGAPVVLIATKIGKASANGKTGDMVQTYILRSDMHPMEALANGADASICGDCKHRPREVVRYHKGAMFRDRVRTCYVEVAKSVASVYGAFTRGRYARAGIDFDKALIPALFEGLAFRLGTYGDPTAAPFQVWRLATLRVRTKTGYSHQWRNPAFSAFKTLCMASADTESEMREAHAMGWRTFRVRGAEEPVFKGLETICPASAEAGFKTSCDKCSACGGLEAKAKVSMVIIAHGATAKHFTIAA